MTESVRFYFSFRSTYSWLAFHRVNLISGELPVKFEYIPIFPPRDFKNDPRLNRHKSDYMNEDVKRIAEAYGLSFKCPDPFDTDWPRPHAAYIYAVDNGKGPGFAQSAFSHRFTRGVDIAKDEVLLAIAKQCDLNPEETLHAANDPKFHNRLMREMSKANKDNIFGVPFFIYKENRYWGNDRIEWLLRDVMADTGSAVPSLVRDPLHRPF